MTRFAPQRKIHQRRRGNLAREFNVEQGNLCFAQFASPPSDAYATTIKKVGQWVLLDRDVDNRLDEIALC